MQLRHLKHFVAVMDSGTVGAAARHIGLTQQALSTSISQLEQSLGVELFQRTQRGMTPTLYAQHLLKYARHLLEDSARVASSLRALRDASSGDVRLGVCETMAGGLAASAIERVMRRVPDVTITLSEGYSEQVLDQLINSQIDVAVASPAASWLGHEDLIAEPVFAVSECVIARAEHPLARYSVVTLEDLSQAMWIQGRFLTESYEALCQCFVAAGLAPPKRLIWSDAFASGLALILRNDIVTFASPGLFEQEIERGSLVALRAERPRRERIAYMFRRRRALQSPALESMLDEMRGLAREVRGSRASWLTAGYAVQ